MKGLLLDENLPVRLTFQPSLPVVSTSVLGASPSDTQVWEYARREELVIVTKDADFSGRIILHTPPGVSRAVGKGMAAGRGASENSKAGECPRGPGRRHQLKAK